MAVLAGWVQTDDDARGLPFWYRGPRGMELPPARPAAYGVAICVTVGFVVLAWLLAPATVVLVAGVLVSPGVGIYVARKVMPHVDYYRTVRHWRTVAKQELAAPRTTRATAPTFETNLSLSIFKEANSR